MGVKDVRVSPPLNQAIWARGVRSPPNRIRVRFERKRNDDENAKEKLYVLASYVEGITSFKVSFATGISRERSDALLIPLSVSVLQGLETTVIEADEE